MSIALYVFMNPKTRSLFGLAPLSHAEFCRSIGLAILHPCIAPRICSFADSMISTRQSFIFLFCKHNHYGGIHDRVKLEVAANIRSFAVSLLPRSRRLDEAAPVKRQSQAMRPTEIIAVNYPGPAQYQH
jgi:hypothetical protein